MIRAVVVLALLTLASADAYSLTLVNGVDEFLEPGGESRDVQLLASATCEEIRTYGDPSADAASFALVYAADAGILFTGPARVEIPRAECLVNPSGEYGAEFSASVQAESDARGLILNEVSVDMIADESPVLAPLESIPSLEDPVEFFVRAAYVGSIVVGEPTVVVGEDRTILWSVELESQANALTRVDVQQESGPAMLLHPETVILAAQGDPGARQIVEIALPVRDLEGFRADLTWKLRLQPASTDLEDLLLQDEILELSVPEAFLPAEEKESPGAATPFVILGIIALAGRQLSGRRF